MKLAPFLFLALQPVLLHAFAPSHAKIQSLVAITSPTSALSLFAQQAADAYDEASPALNRRDWLQKKIFGTILATTAASNVLASQPAWAAAQRPPLPSLLYTICRVREATQQETRLIKSGKFKDVQRANVKLAVRFMVENYRLADAFVAAAAYLDGNERRIAAGDVGQAAVQNLVTILEYFDSSDVQNLKVRVG